MLLPVFAFMTMDNIKRQRSNGFQLMAQKGATIIRSFEAGTRTGMLEIHWGHARLQHLASEIAQQPDIDYILLADVSGTIIVHSDENRIGERYQPDIDLNTVAAAKVFETRVLEQPDGEQVFVVFKPFAPMGRPDMQMMGMQRGRRRMPHIPQWFTDDMKLSKKGGGDAYLIFVGLKMDALQAAQRADIRKSILMAIVMLMVGLAGIMLLFLGQAYRSARTSLSHVRAFSDKVMKQMPMGLIALDPEKRVTAFNEAAESLFHLASYQAVGRQAADILPQAVVIPIDGLDENCPVISREVSCPVNSKQDQPVQLSAATLFDEHKTFLGYVILLKDLSEIKNLRERIARNQRMATVGRLAAGVAHEIRNPLSSIKGFATYFKERYNTEAEDQSISTIMIQEVERLNRVVGELLDFSKPLSLSREQTPVGDFLADSLKRIETVAAEQQVALVQEDTDQGLTMDVDPDKISQVLLNLYLNAMDAIDGSGRLTVAARMNGDALSISVTDSGRGIEAEKLPKIFDPYFTTKSTGTGLGLAIAHNIVEAHGGRIHVESTVGEGTRVTFSLPTDTSV